MTRKTARWCLPSWAGRSRSSAPRPGSPRPAAAPRAGPVSPPPPRGSQPLLADLNLSRGERDKARDALFAYDETVRKATEAARQDLLTKMKDAIPESEFRKFRSELEAVPLVAPVPVGPRGVPEEDLVQRLLSFDQNRDGVLTIDELPERMHALFVKGDKNKDGVLDVEEIRQLAKEEARPVPPGRGGRGQGPPPGAGRGGRGG